MSQENVEIVQRVVAASQRGDGPTAIAAFDPKVALDQSRVLDGGVSHGHDGVRAYFRRWFGTWEDLEITPERFIDVDDNRVLVLLKFTGTRKGKWRSREHEHSRCVHAGARQDRADDGLPPPVGRPQSRGASE